MTSTIHMLVSPQNTYIAFHGFHKVYFQIQSQKSMSGKLCTAPIGHFLADDVTAALPRHPDLMIHSYFL